MWLSAISSFSRAAGFGITANGEENQWHLNFVSYDGEALTFHMDGEPARCVFWGSNRHYFCGNMPMDTGPLTIGD